MQKEQPPNKKFDIRRQKSLHIGNRLILPLKHGLILFDSRSNQISSESVLTGAEDLENFEVNLQIVNANTLKLIKTIPIKYQASNEVFEALGVYIRSLNQVILVFESAIFLHLSNFTISEAKLPWVSSLDYSEQSGTAYFGTPEGKILCYKYHPVKSWTQKNQINTNAKGLEKIVYLSNYEMLACFYRIKSSCKLILIDISSNKVLKTVSFSSDSLSPLIFSPKQEYFVTGKLVRRTENPHSVFLWKNKEDIGSVKDNQLICFLRFYDDTRCFTYNFQQGAGIYLNIYNIQTRDFEVLSKKNFDQFTGYCHSSVIRGSPFILFRDNKNSLRNRLVVYCVKCLNEL